MDTQVKKRFGLLSIIGGVSGLLSLWFADVYSLILGVAAVFLSIFGFRRGERLSALGMILGCIAIIFFNLQSMGIIQSNSKINEDMKHFFQSIIISNQAYEILKNCPPHKRLSDEDAHKMITLWEKAIKEAKKVDIANINRYAPELGKHYKDGFIKGLCLLVDGFKDSHDGKKLQGALLMDSWGRWNNKNRNIYKKIKKTNMSLIGLLHKLLVEHST